MASSVPLVKTNCSGLDAEVGGDGLFGLAVFGIDGQAAGVEAVLQGLDDVRASSRRCSR